MLDANQFSKPKPLFVRLFRDVPEFDEFANGFDLLFIGSDHHQATSVRVGDKLQLSLLPELRIAFLFFGHIETKDKAE